MRTTLPRIGFLYAILYTPKILASRVGRCAVLRSETFGVGLTRRAYLRCDGVGHIIKVRRRKVDHRVELRFSELLCDEAVIYSDAIRERNGQQKKSNYLWF